MAKEKKQSRKDDKGRVLRKGESQRKDGTYMYRYLDECKKRHSIYAKTLPELREKALKIEKDKMDNISLTNDYTVDQLVNAYFKLYHDSDHLSLNTQISNKYAYEYHIKDSWISHKKIKDIKNSDIILFYKGLSETLKNNSIHVVHRVLSQSFKLALTNHMIRFDPTKGALKLFPKDEKEKIILTPQQLEALLNFVKDNNVYYRWHPLLVILTETMIRGSELCGLTWNDVDLKHKFIQIDHQIQYKKINGKFTLHAGPPKTKKGYRKIPLTEKAYNAFLEQKRLQFSLNLYSTARIDKYENFVFPTRQGNPNQVMALDNMLRNLTNCYNREHTDSMPHLSCHVFRHTGCTIMAKKMFKLGLDPKILQQWMGHSSIKMTLDLYNHASDEESKNAIDELNKIAL